MTGSVLWIGYTTRYRGGSDKFARAATTLQAELQRARPNVDVRLEALEHKADFAAAMARIRATGGQIEELHFFGHSGMYGIMFGSRSWPEQFSPHEWRALSIPFSTGARAYFHACRTARWFAPFFARTFGVETYGHHGYTTVSRRPDRFVFEGFRENDGAIYLVSVPGRKTHGLFGSVRKYARRPRALPMLAFAPGPAPAADYDAVAALYDRAFADIRVRRDEWAWLSRRVAAAAAHGGRAPRVLDIGCGNGSLLLQLADYIALGVGVDNSRRMLHFAQERARSCAKLSFRAIDGPALPFPDGSFDVVTSFLSFRYLDWDPMLQEIRRVLAPGGRLLVVDMVERAVRVRDTASFARSAAQHVLLRVAGRGFQRNLRALTSHSDWATLLRHKPIRAEHEYRFYFESRFPGSKLETLNVGRHARVVAFDSGALGAGSIQPLSYP
jgi:ubiquinone/menaquinone biosynthesis C-methylase UbiE